MCVLAGYIGDQPAAPVLLEMLRRRDGTIDMKPFRNLPHLLPAGKGPSPQALVACVQEYIKSHPECTMGDLKKAINPLWPDDVVKESSLTVYEMLETLVRDGKVKMISKKIPGMFEQGLVPKTYLVWN